MNSAQPESVARRHWHRRLYDGVIHFADTKNGERALFVLGFAESSFFPVPPGCSAWSACSRDSEKVDEIRVTLKK